MMSLGHEVLLDLCLIKVCRYWADLVSLVNLACSPYQPGL